MRKYYSRCLFFDRYRNMSINICFVCLIILFVLVLLLFLFFKFDFCTSYDGYVVKGDEFYVRTFLNDSSIRDIQKNTLVVNGNVVDYNIISISDEYVLPGLRSVMFKFEMEDDMKVVNNIIRLHFLDRMTFFERIKERFL